MLIWRIFLTKNMAEKINGPKFAVVFMVLVFKIEKTSVSRDTCVFNMFKVYVNGIRRLIS